MDQGIEFAASEATSFDALPIEKLTPTLLTQLEYTQRTVYVEKLTSSTSLGIAAKSDVVSLGNISSLGHADSTCESGSVPSEYTDYLLYVKECATFIRSQSSSRETHARHGSKKPHRQIDIAGSDHDGSSCDSTVGLANMQHDSTHINMCDNPGDMWHGLKTSDGKPVVLHPLKSKRTNRYRQLPFTTTSSGKKWPSLTKMLHTIRHKNIKNRYDGIINRHGDTFGNKSGSGNGPINYSGGFLNINRYIKRTNANPNTNFGTSASAHTNNLTGGCADVGVKKDGNVSKFVRRNSDTGKYEFPMPQHIPKHLTKQTAIHNVISTTNNTKITTAVSCINTGISTGVGKKMGKNMGLDKAKGRADKGFVHKKAKSGKHPDLQSQHSAQTPTNTSNNANRVHKKKKRKMPRMDLDANNKN